MTPLALLDMAARGLVVALFAGACVIAGTHWLVRTRRLNPFGAWARFIRRLSDPILVPVERRLVRAGRNPQDAGLAIVLVTLFGGLALLFVVRWLAQMAYGILALGEAGPQAIALQLAAWTFDLLSLALLVRVVTSWFGVSPYARWMRPVVFLTDWLLEPLRRILPPFGPFDLSPIVAWFLLRIARSALFTLLLGG